jgi:hypothetical protein
MVAPARARGVDDTRTAGVACWLPLLANPVVSNNSNDIAGNDSVGCSNDHMATASFAPSG